MRISYAHWLIKPSHQMQGPYMYIEWKQTTFGLNTDRIIRIVHAALKLGSKDDIVPILDQALSFGTLE